MSWVLQLRFSLVMHNKYKKAVQKNVELCLLLVFVIALWTCIFHVFSQNDEPLKSAPPPGKGQDLWYFVMKPGAQWQSQMTLCCLGKWNNFWSHHIIPLVANEDYRYLVRKCSEKGVGGCWKPWYLVLMDVTQNKNKYSFFTSVITF